MSWLFSQALVVEYLGENFSDGEQSAPLNGNLTQPAYCAPDKMTAFSRLSRFGMTFKPLTVSRGEELLMSYLVAFPVRTSAPLGGGLALTESAAECGEKWRGSFTKYDPDLRLWKTHQCSLLGDLEPFLETWPQWGLMRDGECWEQQTLAQTIKGTESGLWATPTRCDYKGTTGTANFESRKRQFNNLTGGEVIGTIYPNPTTYEVMMGWPLGWTDLKPLEMGKSHCAPQQPGEF